MPKRRPFRVVELGCGSDPVGLFKLARRSERLGRNRSFIGVNDLFADQGTFSRRVSLNSLLVRFGVRKNPKNLNLISKCAVHALEGLAAGSQDLIFEAYLLNNIGRSGQCEGKNAECLARLYEQAHRVLRPGGKFIAIQDLGIITTQVAEAKMYGFNLTIFKIPDRALKKSHSQAIRDRSTPWKRMDYLKFYAGLDGDMQLTEAHINALKKRGVIKSAQEYALPVVYLMTKTRKAPRQEKEEPQIPREVALQISKLLGIPLRHIEIFAAEMSRLE